MMIPQQDKYIDFVNRTLDKEIFIRKTGKKEINMVAHAHEKYQIVYTFMGTIHVQIEGTSYFVPEKHIAWIPSRMVHEISSNNRQVSLVIFYMVLGEVADEDVKRQFAIYNTNTMIAGNLKFIASKGPMINGEQEASLFDFSLAFFRLLPLVVPKSEILLKTLVIPNDPRLLPILDYMKNHVCESLTIERVAHEYGLSVRSLSRLFNGSGICFSNYMNHQRVMRAIEMLADGGKTMQQVAYEVGFNTPSHFNRVFKQLTGMSPSLYTKRG